MLNDAFSDLLETDMTRKEFLLYLGSAFLGVIGVSSLLKTLTEPATRGQAQSLTYDDGVYGGRSR